MGVGNGDWGEPGLTKLCVAGWTAEDRTEVEEEVVVEEEEEEESGSLDEEEIKKMQSDEVSGDSPSGASAVVPSGWAWATEWALYYSFLHSPLCPLGHSRPGGDSI